MKTFITNNSETNLKKRLLDLMLGKVFYGLEYEEILHIMNYDFEIRGGIKLQQPFITLVDQILTAKQQPPSSPFSNGELSNADTSTLEKQIDEMVYKLYTLTPEEISIVEGKR